MPMGMHNKSPNKKPILSDKRLGKTASQHDRKLLENNCFVAAKAQTKTNLWLLTHLYLRRLSGCQAVKRPPTSHQGNVTESKEDLRFSFPDTLLSENTTRGEHGLLYLTSNNNTPPPSFHSVMVLEVATCGIQILPSPGLECSPHYSVTETTWETRMPTLTSIKEEQHPPQVSTKDKWGICISTSTCQ